MLESGLKPWRKEFGMESQAFPKELIDAANRMRDAVNLHVVVSPLLGDRQIGFLAIELETGAAHDNGTLYPDRKTAVRHTRNRGNAFFYVKVGAESMSEREAIIVLQMARQAYKNGVIFAEEEPVVPMLTELALPYIPNTLRKLPGGIIIPNRRTTR
jgi:hypothetical protein